MTNVTVDIYTLCKMIPTRNASHVFFSKINYCIYRHAHVNFLSRVFYVDSYSIAGNQSADWLPHEYACKHDIMKHSRRGSSLRNFSHANVVDIQITPTPEGSFVNYITQVWTDCPWTHTHARTRAHAHTRTRAQAHTQTSTRKRTVLNSELTHYPRNVGRYK